uniref:PLDc_3 domain-containing protein n=1 Tax=Heterorhabditis bacteriophora TaxID=37862 RepID=A0A1I7WYP1_HETBA
MKETTQELAGTSAGFTYKESIKENQAVNSQKIGVSHISLYNLICIFITFIIPFIAIFFFSASVLKHNNEQYNNEQRCYKTCSIKIVESVPDNVTFCNATLPPSTFYAWRRLIEVSEKELYITAYKSSLQGKHVLGQLSHQFSREAIMLMELFYKIMDLKTIFEIYWKVPTGSYRTALDKKASYNMQRPLKIQIEGEESEIYLATSPKELNNIQRTWDLDAIVGEIDRARQFLNIHVMDYFPLFIYRKPRTHFPTIDDALRRAIVRGVRVRILAAALHYPQIGTRFLRSLQSLSEMNENTTVEVVSYYDIMAFTKLIYDDLGYKHSVFLSTYLPVVSENFQSSYDKCRKYCYQSREKNPQQIHGVRDSCDHSEYAHPLEDYFVHCVETFSADFCEGEKDPSLFASPQNVD